MCTKPTVCIYLYSSLSSLSWSESRKIQPILFSHFNKNCKKGTKEGVITAIKTRILYYFSSFRFQQSANFPRHSLSNHDSWSCKQRRVQGWDQLLWRCSIAHSRAALTLTLSCSSQSQNTLQVHGRRSFNVTLPTYWIHSRGYGRYLCQMCSKARGQWWGQRPQQIQPRLGPKQHEHQLQLQSPSNFSYPSLPSPHYSPPRIPRSANNQNLPRSNSNPWWTNDATTAITEDQETGQNPHLESEPKQARPQTQMRGRCAHLRTKMQNHPRIPLPNVNSERRIMGS